MKRMFKKLIAVSILSSILLTIFAGCSSYPSKSQVETWNNIVEREEKAAERERVKAILGGY